MFKQRIKHLQAVHVFLKPIIGVLLLIIFGTLGYINIEHWNLVDSLFMSVMTLSTVGYEIPYIMSLNGTIFTIVYIVFGVILFLYFAAQFAKNIIQANFEGLFKKKSMDKKIQKLKNHNIICGYGRTGIEIAKILLDEKIDFIIIDKDPEFEAELKELGSTYLIGDATNDETLIKAGIEKANGIFCTLSDDVDNLYLTLSAKNIKSDLKIVARCVKAANENKFYKTGATNVILPYEISGSRMVFSVLRPKVTNFLDVVMHTRDKDLELKMEQYCILENCLIANKTVMSSNLRQETGIIIIAIERNDKYITNPESNEVLEINDTLIILGTGEQLTAFDNFVKK